ncbi:DUF4238 domain-containing protein [Aliarcobacter butzleri]|uniref:DUF4238 domain-containing protein n=1 Tax=Aliarcobacter butzleri TaxID=28197 RepID=UPI002B242B2F|nr:DUF4238 domain-containing protein [Aliarcobacter butzleri]
MIKTRHHYVARYYLKAWIDNKEQITVYRKLDKVFKTNLMNVAQKRFFYELQNLTLQEINFVKSVINLSPNGKLKKINEKWLEMYIFIFKIEKQIKKYNIKNNELLEKMILKFKKNFEEDYHEQIESMGYKYLDLIRKENIDFYYDKESEDRMKFLYYICVQYFRTNNIKQKIINEFQNEPINMNKIHNVMANIYSTNVAYNLHLDKSMNLFLLINSTNLEFITGDQPVLNTHGVYNNCELKNDEFELYYPISPKLAILISNKNFKNKLINIKNENHINKYNNYIIHSSFEQIFATNEQTILLYKAKFNEINL